MLNGLNHAGIPVWYIVNVPFDNMKECVFVLLTFFVFHFVDFAYSNKNLLY